MKVLLVFNYFLILCEIRKSISMSSSSSSASLVGTFHRKPLPFPAIPFSSKTGIRYFKEALELNYMKIYFPLSESFQTQGDPSYCGLGSLTMVLNAMLLDPQRVWKGNHCDDIE